MANILDIAHHLKLFQRQNLGNWICFCPQVKIWKGRDHVVFKKKRLGQWPVSEIVMLYIIISNLYTQPWMMTSRTAQYVWMWKIIPDSEKYIIVTELKRNVRVISLWHNEFFSKHGCKLQNILTWMLILLSYIVLHFHILGIGSWVVLSCVCATVNT